MHVAQATAATISSDKLSVEVSSLGAELQRITDSDGRQLLWDGDPSVWHGRAPILFPVIGLLVNGSYRLDGTVYPMPKHGFARDSAWRVGGSAPAPAFVIASNRGRCDPQIARAIEVASGGGTLSQSQITGLFGMVSWASVDRSIWALVAGSFLSSMARAILSHAFLSGTPNRLHWDSAIFWEIIGFGKWIFLSSVIGFLVLNGDRLILGGLVDSATLGVYVVAYLLLSTADLVVSKAVFDVSHEVIHFLAPVPKANALEEGLAIHFSLKHGCDSVPQLSKARNQLPLPYQKALAVYEEFVANGGDIKTLRQHEPYISKASHELIKHCAPKCGDELIAKLLGLIDDL